MNKDLDAGGKAALVMCNFYSILKYSPLNLFVWVQINSSRMKNIVINEMSNSASDAQFIA